MNSIYTIRPIKNGGVWSFTDKERGLVNEPFISDANSIIDALCVDIKDAEKGFNLLFSDQPFAGYDVCADWIKAEYNGNWYQVGGICGWLCSALNSYYKDAPKELYIAAAP